MQFGFHYHYFCLDYLLYLQAYHYLKDCLERDIGPLLFFHYIFTDASQKKEKTTTFKFDGGILEFVDFLDEKREKLQNKNGKWLAF